MTLRGLFDTIVLRWYVAAVIVLLTAAAGWKVDHPPKYYEATVVLLLVPPKEPDAPNALAAVTPSIAQTGVLVDTVLSDSTSADRLRKAGVTGDFTVAPRNNGTIQTPHYTVPAEQLTVNSADPNAAVSSVSILSGLFKQELSDLQASVAVPAKDRITTQVLVPPTATPVKGSKSRGLIGVAAIGAIAMILIPVWFDRVARRRAHRKARAAARKQTATTKTTKRATTKTATSATTATTATATPSTESAKERYAAS